MNCSTNVKFNKTKTGPLTSNNDVNNTGLGSSFTDYLPALNAYPSAEGASSGSDKVEEPSESNKQLLEHEELDDSILTLGSNTGPKPMPVPVLTVEPSQVASKSASLFHPWVYKVELLIQRLFFFVQYFVDKAYIYLEYQCLHCIVSLS